MDGGTRFRGRGTGAVSMDSGARCGAPRGKAVAGSRSSIGRWDASYRSLRVTWRDRWRLWRCACSDRRAGLPLGLHAGTTPLLRELVARHDEACEAERQVYLAARHRLVVRLAELIAGEPALVRIVDTRAADVAAARGAEVPRSRKAGEEPLPEALVRSRRLAEHRRTVDAAVAAHEEAQRRLDAAVAEQSHLQELLRALADEARSRALRLTEHTERLAAIYRRSLVERHRQRDDLLANWTLPVCRPPAWVDADLLPTARTAEVTA